MSSIASRSKETNIMNANGLITVPILKGLIEGIKKKTIMRAK